MDSAGMVSGCQLTDDPLMFILFLSCRIFAGYNKAVRMFDIHRPGRDFKQHSTLQGNKEGQTGACSYFNHLSKIFFWSMK